MLATGKVFEERRVMGTISPTVLEDLHGNNMALVGTASYTEIDSRLQVLTLDGDSDYAYFNTPDFIDGEYSGGIGIWFKTSLLDTNQVLICSADNSGSNNYLMLYVRSTNNIGVISNISGTLNGVMGGTKTVSDGNWHFAFLVSTSTAWLLYLDGEVEVLSSITGSNTGHWFGNIQNRDNLSVGVRLGNTPDLFFNGQLSLPIIYQNVVPAEKIANRYQREKYLFPGA